MTLLQISAIAGLVVALILAIIVWTIVAIEYKKIRQQKKINKLIKRIKEKAEDSGNKSEGDTDELAQLIEMEDFDP
uniref:Protein Vpu n=1 Tax=Human immunodeficiency virus type 1 TaxID=11676 RepID=A0A6J3WAR5_HV1|nr:vpu protein [Human immunodeficiency virus 1]